jgi:hypothetical protein
MNKLLILTLTLSTTIVNAELHILLNSPEVKKILDPIHNMRSLSTEYLKTLKCMPGIDIYKTKFEYDYISNTGYVQTKNCTFNISWGS